MIHRVNILRFPDVCRGDLEDHLSIVANSKSPRTRSFGKPCRRQILSVMCVSPPRIPDPFIPDTASYEVVVLESYEEPVEYF